MAGSKLTNLWISFRTHHHRMQ